MNFGGVNANPRQTGAKQDCTCLESLPGAWNGAAWMLALLCSCLEVWRPQLPLPLGVTVLGNVLESRGTLGADVSALFRTRACETLGKGNAGTVCGAAGQAFTMVQEAEFWKRMHLYLVIWAQPGVAHPALCIESLRGSCNWAPSLLSRAGPVSRSSCWPCGLFWACPSPEGLQAPSSHLKSRGE